MSSEYSKGTLLLLATKELTRPSVILVKYTVTAVSMLRSVGMQKGGFRRMMCYMMCYECLIYGLRSILYGVILSLLVSFLIYRVLAGGMDTNYLVPWEYIGIAVGFVFLVVGLTMIYTMGIIQKQNIIDELKMS